MSTKLFLPRTERKNEHRTSNVQSRQGVTEWNNMKKQSLKPELLDDILQETEGLIKIFITSIKMAEKKPRLGVVEFSGFDVYFFIRCWTFIFQKTPYGINATCECLPNNLALMGAFLPCPTGTFALNY